YSSMLSVFSRRPKVFVNTLSIRIPSVFVDLKYSNTVSIRTPSVFVYRQYSNTVSIRLPSVFVYRQYSYTVFSRIPSVFTLSIRIPSVFVYRQYSYTRRRFLVGVGGAGVGAGAVWLSILNCPEPNVSSVQSEASSSMSVSICIHSSSHLLHRPLTPSLLRRGIHNPHPPGHLFSPPYEHVCYCGDRGLCGGVCQAGWRASSVANSSISRPSRISSFKPALANRINCCSVRSPTIGKL
ncbi:LOW QUALITY PROTEIN: hypothetical protein HID58_070599, partial [Brassica napus]